MPVNDLAIALNKARDLKSKFAYRRAHAIDCSVIFPRVAEVGNEAVDRPYCCVRRRFLQRWSPLISSMAVVTLNISFEIQSSIEKRKLAGRCQEDASSERFGESAGSGNSNGVHFGLQLDRRERLFRTSGFRKALRVLVGLPGFEPGTSCTPSKRASQAAPQPDPGNGTP